MTAKAVIVDNDMNMDMFSDAVPNPEQTEAKIMGPSMSFLDKVLHPPSSVPGFAGLPTNDARSQVLAEYRNLVIMKNPTVLLDSASTTTVVSLTNAQLNTFNVGFLVTNGARVLSVGYVFNTATGAWYQDLNNTDVQDVYDFNNWRKDAQLFRPAYKSLTTYLNATAFNNTGSVAVSSFNPAMIFAGTLVTLSHSDPMLFKDFVHSVHEDGNLFLDSSHEDYSIGIQNYLSFSIQARDDISKLFRSGKNGKDISVSLDPGTTVQMLMLGQVDSGASGPTGTLATIPTTSMMLNQSQRSYAGKAMEGTFSVSKFNTIAPRWQSAVNGDQPSAAAFIDGLYQCYLVSYRADGTRRVNTLREPAAVGTLSTAVPNLCDTLWTPDMTMTWIRYEGLSFNPTQTQNQLLIRKYYTGIEIQPALQSAWAGMQKSGPPPDLQAMQSIMDGFYTLKDGMPAKYNFWGTLGSIAASGLQTFGASLLKKLWNTKESNSATDAKAPATAAVKVKQPKKKTNNREKDLERKIDSLTAKIKDMSMRKESNFRPKWQTTGAPASAGNTQQLRNNIPQPPPRRRRRNRNPRKPRTN